MPDTSQDSPRATTPVPVPRRRVLAWALWDWGSAAFQAVITTFVFTRWITSDAFVDPATVAAAEAEPGGDGPANALLDAALADHSAWLGWGLAGAGVLIALLAPVTGSSADRTGRRKRWLGVHTAITVLISISMFFVTPDPGSLEQNLLLGIFLLAVGHVFFELAGVNYNAMLAQVSTPGTVGKVSGIGWGAGYVGGIVLLLLLFVGFIDPEVGWFGVTDEGGLDIRVAVLFSAIWFAVFALPVFFAVPELPVAGRPERRGVVAAYRALAADVVRLWRTSRPTVGFLVASAVYRDGLSGVFVFGAIIASTTFGFTAGQVIQFAIAANVVAGLATVAAGWLDDRIGPKAVVVGSLVGLVVARRASRPRADAARVRRLSAPRSSPDPGQHAPACCPGSSASPVGRRAREADGRGAAMRHPEPDSAACVVGQPPARRAKEPTMTPTTDPTPTVPTVTNPAHAPVLAAPAAAHGARPCGADHACAGPTRRSVLRGAGAVSLGAAALVLAACAAPADGDDEPAAGGGASADGGGSGAVLARLEDVPVGGALSVDGPDDVPLVLVQPTAGTVVAYVAVCTHQGCTVVPDRDVLVCPCHASVFSTEDGSVTTGPAEEPLGQLPVRVVDGEVLVA
ncbi:MFS transporter [Cellulomonas cellasea]|uniref:Rieske domain-containing protein n=2 Tax=Cellulomonas cellasea TaxID=43670 RepID=A0A4Y3KVZ0_9CELL|nr:MFS transporter [Cellulomonas cellasea]GEA87028.1 hypothetical protein CCE01nite_09770 [Cellulomonas cellasea]